MNKVEEWKRAKHGLDVWPEVVRHAEARTPMGSIDETDLERMKYYGVFYRKRDEDGRYMLRLRVTGGEMTSQQAKEIAYIAYEYGHGIVDLTTRANIQIQGLPIEHVPRALVRLEECGLTCRQTGHDNVRNVFGHPLSGLDPEEIIDTRELCRDVTALFLGNRKYSGLPRKFNIAFNGRPHAGIHWWTQDLSFLATRDADGEPAFHLLVGGKQGQRPFLGVPLPVLVRPERCVEVVEALLDLFRERGPRDKRDESRFCFLLEQIGTTGVLAWLGERLEPPLTPSVAVPAGPIGHEDLVGWMPQKQAGRWAMGIHVPVGRIGWDQLEGLAVAAKRWGSGLLRLTTDQGIAIVDIPTGFRDAAATAIARHNLDAVGDSPSRAVICCTGKQFCNIGVTETKSHALALIDDLRKRSLALHGVRIHMSGCPAACAMHHTADIGLKGVRVRRLFGTAEGFDVYLGGGLNSQLHLGLPYRSGVDIHQLPQLVEEVVKEYYLKHLPGQTFSAYWREQLRDQAAGKATDGDYQPTVWECDRCQHHYHGEDPPVFCPQCASLRRHFARLEKEPSASQESPKGVAAKRPVPPSAPLAAATPAAAKPNDGYVPGLSLAELPEGRGVEVTIGGETVALFREGEQVYAVEPTCPHAGAPLAEGTISGGVITCPWHEWRFDACTGCNAAAHRAGLKAYPARVVDGRVEVLLAIESDGSTPRTTPAQGRSVS